MSDINITYEGGSFCSNDFTVAPEKHSVSFSTDTRCTVCFAEPATFGVSQVTVDPGLGMSLPIVERTSTMFLPIRMGIPCEFEALVASSPGVHTISIGAKL